MAAFRHHALTTVLLRRYGRRRLDVAAAGFLHWRTPFSCSSGEFRAIGQPHFIDQAVPAADACYFLRRSSRCFVGDIRISDSARSWGGRDEAGNLAHGFGSVHRRRDHSSDPRGASPKILPEPFLSAPMRAMPNNAHLLVMFYGCGDLRTAE